ncbi:sensor histidine kinase [Streptomyces rhizosphaerihabitans]|uniref:sensor histidine kinase n=1 Tax=Streptomyces rhizosphaerihabitans TaxID=1266770 RepID=UPI0021BF2564|nr:HAMP domain-containing sensor histidine kinase [Streptomyces rhizosphaerihabitans]MCT9007921.1 HAMP domain-containing histidine kinase [Streptomyces rhizosphaerihabitans]
MSRAMPLRRSLLVRLLITSVLIALCSVAATAWLAVQTTTRAIQEEQGQVLAEDMDILRQLSGYAAGHPDWSGVAGTLRTISHRTGRRIALTAGDRTPFADSAARGTSLPPRAAATVDPLRTDTSTEPGAQLAGVDPRAVGPYRLPATERLRVAKLATVRQLCFARNGIQTRLERMPSGRTVLTDEDGRLDSGYVPTECADGLLNTPTPTEQKALDALSALTRTCLDRHKVHLDHPVALTLEAAGGATPAPYLIGKRAVDQHGAPARTTNACVDDARRRQLAPYVAPVAELFLGTGDRPVPRFDMSAANKAKVFGVAGLVLALTVAVTALVATRLVRPLRALTQAAQQPPERHVRVPVTTQDETGILALAFNELTERRERMEAQRKAMVSDIAHELRTPLTNIRGWLEVARDGLVDPDPELLSSLHEEAVVLQRVIDDLQDLAAADAGTLRLHREDVRADELLEQVAAAHRVGAEAAGIRLVTEVAGTPWLDADPVRMRQALGNLVSNATRHTPAGGTVTLSARHEVGEVVFEVADTGAGIDPADLASVFDRFWRAEKSRSRRTGGSGLGLDIVRQLVAAHGGTVSVASEVGTGTVFTLRLPCAQEPASHATGSG